MRWEANATNAINATWFSRLQTASAASGADGRVGLDWAVLGRPEVD